MSLRGQPARQLGALFVTSVLLGIGIACSASPAGPGPTSDPNPTSGPSPTTGITISPAPLEASVSDPVRPDGRYVINPSVTFSAVGTAAATVKEVRFSFVVDADRVIKQGVVLVHGGDLRGGPVTQQYPLTV